ncbi:uroporphyrinogen-III synthase [Sandaracinobacter sp.]|uniref:uroporphyrinogen-III synthase n=1 Tax=Sandaracinobacter sp. TaxID=2487581 RepID=UPI0035B3D147
MTRPLLLLTRPGEEAEATASAAGAAGFETLSAPLLHIDALDWSLPADAAPDALLFTSARAPHIVASRRPDLRSLPAYAVGPNTAAAVGRAGFRLAAVGEADGSAIVARAAAGGVRNLLHMAGEQAARLDVPEGIRLTRVPVYAARLAADLPEAALEALRSGALFATLLFSPRTAAHFRQLLDQHRLVVGAQRIIALSSAVAEAAGDGWQDVGVAASPTREQALAAAMALWQGKRHG